MLYLNGLLVITGFMTILWLISLVLKNASIVDPFWGFGFVLINTYYLIGSGIYDTRSILVMVMVAVWGLRLTIHLMIRNAGKGEDFRYRKFREDYGAHRYWWVSFFQVFLLQAVLLWLVSAPLLALNRGINGGRLSLIDFAGIALYLIGLAFEAGGDYQLVKFKSNPLNRGKLLTTGFWKYTRHPNYFGDAAVWWGFGLMGIGSGGYINALGSVLMTLLLIRISGVLLLEKTLKVSKPGYSEYAARTSAFIPWFPRRPQSIDKK